MLDAHSAPVFPSSRTVARESAGAPRRPRARIRPPLKKAPSFPTKFPTGFSGYTDKEGSMRARRVMLAVVATLIAAGTGAALYFEPWREPGADDRYDVTVLSPALHETTPRVHFDHGHNNVHSATGRYRPFVRLIESDGCKVYQSSAVFTPEVLEKADILVVVNAKGPQPNEDAGAFTTAEIDAV